MGVQTPKQKGNCLGLPGPFKSIGNLRCSGCCSVAAAFAAKGMIQSPITSCNRRDQSVRQASANSILKNSGRRLCGLSAVKGVVGLHSMVLWAKSDIYECFVLFPVIVSFAH